MSIEWSQYQEDLKSGKAKPDKEGEDELVRYVLGPSNENGSVPPHTGEKDNNTDETDYSWEEDELEPEPTLEEKRHNARIAIFFGLGLSIFGVLLILVGQEGGVVLLLIGLLFFLFGFLFWLKYM